MSKEKIRRPSSNHHSSYSKENNPSPRLSNIPPIYPNFAQYLQQAKADGEGAFHRAIMTLHRTIGNQAIRKILLQNPHLSTPSSFKFSAPQLSLERKEKPTTSSPSAPPRTGSKRHSAQEIYQQLQLTVTPDGFEAYGNIPKNYIHLQRVEDFLLALQDRLLEHFFPNKTINKLAKNELTTLFSFQGVLTLKNGQIIVDNLIKNNEFVPFTFPHSSIYRFLKKISVKNPEFRTQIQANPTSSAASSVVALSERIVHLIQWMIKRQTNVMESFQDRFQGELNLRIYHNGRLTEEFIEKLRNTQSFRNFASQHKSLLLAKPNRNIALRLISATRRLLEQVLKELQIRQYKLGKAEDRRDAINTLPKLSTPSLFGIPFPSFLSDVTSFRNLYDLYGLELSEEKRVPAGKKKGKKKKRKTIKKLKYFHPTKKYFHQAIRKTKGFGKVKVDKFYQGNFDVRMTWLNQNKFLLLPFSTASSSLISTVKELMKNRNQWKKQVRNYLVSNGLWAEIVGIFLEKYLVFKLEGKNIYFMQDQEDFEKYIRFIAAMSLGPKVFFRKLPDLGKKLSEYIVNKKSELTFQKLLSKKKNAHIKRLHDKYIKTVALIQRSLPKFYQAFFLQKNVEVGPLGLFESHNIVFYLPFYEFAQQIYWKSFKRLFYHKVNIQGNKRKKISHLKKLLSLYTPLKSDQTASVAKELVEKVWGQGALFGKNKPKKKWNALRTKMRFLLRKHTTILQLLSATQEIKQLRKQLQQSNSSGN
ncbi:MAG: hypothetical protein D6805_07895 [Planctomycetota bacterium]|nr:MAG: hypothetical protein D6805_07895 [Planctomycetota bacterium]